MLNGATRLHLIVGDPVAQTKSPAGLTAAFAARGANAICVPLHVTREDFDEVLGAAKRAQNIDGIVITLPHKFAAFSHCDRFTERARRLGAVNVMRREARHWAGDMTDGEGLIAALRARGLDTRGRRALVIGAGGAGSAVALALLEADIAALALADIDGARRDALIAKLASLGAVRAGSADPAGFSVVVNATPAGMKTGDALPVDVARLDTGAIVADLITEPADTPLLVAARRAGCQTLTGADIFEAQSGLLADILLARIG